MLIQKKICLLGDFAVGKTSLVRRYIEGRFDDKYLSTIGVKISRKVLERGDHQLKLLIWDVAGGEEFIDYQDNYLRGAAGALIVCDLTRQDTLQHFIEYASQLGAINPEAVFVFLGNKLDLEDDREISDGEIEDLCVSLGGPHLLTSAKNGDCVEAAFKILADLIESKNDPGE